MSEETPREIEGFRLSPQQRRTWNLTRSGGAWGCRCALEVPSAIGEKELRHAWRTAGELHDALRTTFVKWPGMLTPVQRVHEPGQAPWSEEAAFTTTDLRGLDETAADRRFEALFRSLLDDVDAVTGPPARALLVQRHDGSRALLIGASPLTVDSRGLDNVIDDLARLAHSFGTRSSGSDEEVVSYPQFAEFQNALLEGEEGAAARELWRKRNPAALARPRLPFSLAAANADRPFVPESVSRSAEPALGEALAARAKKHGESPAALLLAAWQTLSWRLGGPREAAVAHLFDGRSYELFAPAVGLFARWLPIHSRLANDLEFGQLAGRLAVDLAEAEDAAEGFLWGEADDAFELGPAAGFVYETAPSGAWRTLRRRTVVERAEVVLRCRHGGGALEYELLCDPDCYDAADLECALGQFHRLLEAALEDPSRRLDRLPLLSESERRRLLAADAPPEGQSAAPRALNRRFEEQARETPDQTAVVFEDQHWTYGELERRANRLARHLRSLGVGPDVPVALLLERSPELIAALLAVWKAGGAYVPLVPSHPVRRLAAMLEDLGRPIVIGESAQMALLEELGGPRVILDGADQAALEAHDDSPLASEADPRNLAYVIFTSGSTGRPKGVMVEHRHLHGYVEAARERLDLDAAASFATVSTFAADLGHTVVFPALISGGTLHLISEDRAADPAALGDYFGRHPIDGLKIVPSHLEVLLEESDGPAPLPRQRLVLGGEALSPSLLAAVLGALPASAEDRAVVFNHYGPSETTVGILAGAVGDFDPRHRTVPLGRPLANVRIYLLDDHLAPVPLFTAGELYAGGVTVSRGYLGHPLLTAERFVPDPFGDASGGRLYRTGDLVRRGAGGGLEFLGRVDNQVKFHGFRVELDELRQTLNHHPGVRDSRVVLRPDAHGHDVLMAYYVARQAVDTGDLADWLRRSVLEETVPNVFVHLRKLPLTLNGKVNFAALPSLEEVRSRPEQSHRAPRTPLEEELAAIWAEVLGIGRVSIDDDFFLLGGHSLLATRVIARIRRLTGGDVPLRLLFENATVEAMANILLERGYEVAVEAGAETEVAATVDDPIASSEDDFESQLEALEALGDEEIDEEIGELATGS